MEMSLCHFGDKNSDAEAYFNTFFWKKCRFWKTHSPDSVFLFMELNQNKNNIYTDLLYQPSQDYSLNFALCLN